MKKARNYAVFKDGHEEDLLYLERDSSGNAIFATKSGIYTFENHIDGASFISYYPCFYRLGPTSFNPANEIDSVMFDDRSLYEYKIEGNGVYICGKILAPVNSDDKTIRKLIMEDLNIKYRKE